MAMNGTVTVHSNAGEGFAKKVQVRKGMTVGEVFAAEMGHEDDGKYRILLNGKPCAASEAVKDGDRIVISPTNIKGA